MKPGMIATRNGRPAYENAPPRLRASQIERPRGMEEPRRSWIMRFVGRG